jgi:threonine dehydrogenase-like Zn-dependent dehydrogenase
MKALLRRASGVQLCQIPVPDLVGPDDVRLRVLVAGLCRTDVQVAAGELPCAAPVVLGHEFAGVIDAVGPAAAGLRPGRLAAVQPVLGCGACPLCRSGDEINCPERTLLGVDRDGAFAEYAVVPARCVFVVPDAVGAQAAAYAEPVAAALGVLTADLPAGQPGLILGRNRFSTLLERLLAAHGFTDLTVCDPAAPDRPPAGAFAFAVETALGPGSLETMLHAVRPRGVVVLKSRGPHGVALPVSLALRKQATIRAVNYGPFRRAVALLAEGRLDLSGLFGETHALEDFARVFRLCRADESAKRFFDPTR